MDETKFWGRLVKALPIIGGVAAIFVPTSISIAMFFAVLSLYDGIRADLAANGAAIEALGVSVEANSVAIKANSVAIEALGAENRAEFQELGEDIDALSADVVDLKIGYAETNGKLDSIEVRLSAVERGLPDVESIDDRFDDLERERAALKERVDALASADAE